MQNQGWRRYGRVRRYFVGVASRIELGGGMPVRGRSYAASLGWKAPPLSNVTVGTTLEKMKSIFSALSAPSSSTSYSAYRETTRLRRRLRRRFLISSSCPHRASQSRVAGPRSTHGGAQGRTALLPLGCDRSKGTPYCKSYSAGGARLPLPSNALPARVFLLSRNWCAANCFSLLTQRWRLKITRKRQAIKK